MSLTPIIIGAGRGKRLRALTADQPKPYAPIGDRRILDWLLESLAEAGLLAPVFIGGYMIDRIRTDYPTLSYCHNDRWETNNILASLFCAEAHMEDGFVCTYGDILFRSDIVCRLLEHPGDAVLCVDTDWRRRYADRSQHPENDAEKIVAESDRVIRVSRAVTADEANGEYIGVAKFSAKGASSLREHYHRLRKRFAGRAWKDGVGFEQAYLIHLFEDMIEAGEPFHMVATQGDYMEVDTEEDFALANAHWPRA